VAKPWTNPKRHITSRCSGRAIRPPLRLDVRPKKLEKDQELILKPKLPKFLGNKSGDIVGIS